MTIIQQVYNIFMQNFSFLYRLTHHFKTISKHKIIVTKLCFKCGLYKQGILHDLSKYSPIEFFAGVKYYQGYRSPIDREREVVGFSRGWLHHEGRNPHHWEHWIDKDYKNIKFIVITMPTNYLIESVLDRIAASKNYNPNYDDNAPLQFFDRGRDKIFMGEENAKRIRFLLEYLSLNGEEKALAFYTLLYKEYKKDNTFDVLSYIES